MEEDREFLGSLEGLEAYKIRSHVEKHETALQLMRDGFIDFSIYLGVVNQLKGSGFKISSSPTARRALEDLGKELGFG